MSPDSIRLTWADNSANETSFKVQRWNGSGFTLAGTLPPNATSFVDSGLAPGTGYFYVVQSSNADGDTYSLGGISAVTLTESPILGTGPLPPSYTAAATDSSSVQLNWTDNANDEQYYLVYRIAPGPQQLVATLGPNATTFTDTGRSPNTQYYYQVFAWNESGSNSPGTTLVATTTPGKPSPPAVQSAAGRSSSEIKVTWVDRSNNETGFRVLRYNGVGWDLVAQTGPNVTSIVDSGGGPSTSYVYLVTAINAAGESWAPDAVWAPTLPPP